MNKPGSEKINTDVHVGDDSAVVTVTSGEHTHSPVDADGTQVEDAGGAHHHIQRDEDVTVEAAEEPGAAGHLRRTDSRVSRACISVPFTPRGVKYLRTWQEKTCTRRQLV